MLDNNDNGPEFSQPHYDVTISEDVLPDTEILQIEATDRDEKHKLSYTIHSSIDAVSMRKFRMDPSTGVLYTAERLDHEAQDKHILNIMVGPDLGFCFPGRTVNQPRHIPQEARAFKFYRPSFCTARLHAVLPLYVNEEVTVLR